MAEAEALPQSVQDLVQQYGWTGEIRRPRPSVGLSPGGIQFDDQGDQLSFNGAIIKRWF